MVETPEVNSIYSRLFAKVLFSARVVGYSSLLFGIDVSSIEAIATLFDYSSDAFQIFLDQHIPQSFRDVFYTYEPARYEVVVSESAIKAFTASNEMTGESKKTDVTMRNRANWIWILSNTSLVIPSFLALIAAFVMVSALDKKEDRVLKLQQEAIGAERKSFLNITSAYSELIKKQLEVIDRFK